MGAVSTRKSSAAERGGSTFLPSVPDAVLPSTRTDLPFSGERKKETVVALSAMVAALLSEMLSSDQIVLAMYKAEAMAKDAGVSDEEFLRVKTGLVKYWARQKAGNPLGGMFG
jgi:predicted TIM-barrel enzyme